MFRTTTKIGSLLLGIALLLLASGCSTDSPIAPSASIRPLHSGSRGGNNTSLEESVEFASRVATADTATRTLTFTGNSEVVVAAHNAEIVRKSHGDETSIQFSDILVGDSVEVRGTRQHDNSVLADRIRVEDDGQNEAEFASSVTAKDTTTRTLNLANGEVVIAAVNAEINHKDHGSDFPIQFNDIMVGDSVEVRGTRQPDNSVLADRIEVESDKPEFEIEFKDSIATIDYSANTFTVFGRTETISTDSNTVIFGKKHHNGTALEDGSADGRDDNSKFSHDTTLTFTDLQVGDLVEVKANRVDATTLLAVKIQQEEMGEMEAHEVEFTAHIASIDLGANTVTFSGKSWIGTVVDGAELLAHNGSFITLADFAVGDFVEVKGFDRGGNNLDIVKMKKES